MTPPQILSRSQRRMEKKQALALLGLVLGVALVSFALGVLVGRSGAPAAEVSPASPATPRVAVNRAPEPSVEHPVETPSSGEGGVAADPQQHTAEKLTFYEALPKGEQPPLGSGINLAPTAQASLPAVVAEPAPAGAGSPGKTATGANPAVVRAKPVPAAAVTAAVGGAYVVQAAAFRQVADAAGLARRLTAKGFPAFVEPVDLGSKGVWQRVYVGPYNGGEAAKGVAERLRADEKLSPLVKKR